MIAVYVAQEHAPCLSTALSATRFMLKAFGLSCNHIPQMYFLRFWLTGVARSHVEMRPSRVGLVALVWQVDQLRFAELTASGF